MKRKAVIDQRQVQRYREQMDRVCACLQHVAASAQLRPTPALQGELRSVIEVLEHYDPFTL